MKATSTIPLNERLKLMLPKRSTMERWKASNLIEVAPPAPTERQYPTLASQFYANGRRKVGRPRTDPNWTAKDIRRRALERQAERYKKRRAKLGLTVRPYRMREGSI